LAPSINAAGAFIAAGFAVADLAAAGFDSAAVRRADFAGPGDFNGFDGAMGDVPEGVFPGFLVAFRIGFLAEVGWAFEGGIFADFLDAARGAFAAAGLRDLLRVFLDIRLPFVAFGRSIMGCCGSCPGQPVSAAGQG
jgi:hypothetical protein